MEYRMATKEDAGKIYEIVQKTIRTIYPRYYLPQIVDGFSKFHNQDVINQDVANGDSYVLLENGKIVGTGTKNENHIVRVYVLPECQGKGFGTFIMNRLEQEIGKKYKMAELDASLPACRLYYKLGYQTKDHGVWDCAKGVTQIYEIMEKDLAKNGTRNKLRLRPYKSGDAKVITSWIHSEEDQRKWSADRYEKYPITPEDMQEQYRSVLSADDFFPMTALDGDKIVGHLILRYPGADKDTIRFGFVIVDDTIRGKGYGKEMLQLAKKYAFEILQAKKITLGVFENNPEAYYCYKAVGFEENDKTLYFECMGEQWKCIEMEIGRN